MEKNKFNLRSVVSSGACLAVKRVAVIIAIAMCFSLSVTAQFKGEKALGLNALGGYYSNNAYSIGLGAKFLYNVSNPIRLAGEADFSYGANDGSIITYGFRDFSLYGHYMFSINEQKGAFYPLVGVGIFNIKAKASLLGVTVTENESRPVFSVGFGADYVLSKSLLMNSELRLKLHGGNHLIFVIGLSYIF